MTLTCFMVGLFFGLFLGGLFVVAFDAIVTWSFWNYKRKRDLWLIAWRSHQ